MSVRGLRFFFFFLWRHGPGPLAPGPWGLGGSSGPLVGGVWILGEDLVGSNGGFKGQVSGKEEKSDTTMAESGISGSIRTWIFC